MKLKAIKITVSGAITCFSMDKLEELKQLQTAVDGFVQAIGIGDELTLWCNEEGKMMGLPHNPYAQKLWDNAFGVDTDYIVGNIVLTGGTDDDGHTLGLTDEQIDNLVFKGLLPVVSTNASTTPIIL